MRSSVHKETAMAAPGTAQHMKGTKRKPKKGFGKKGHKG